MLKRAGFSPRCKVLKRKQTFDMVDRLISPATGEPRLIVNKTCPKLIQQIQGASHKTLRGKIIDEPEDGKGDDLLDCLRYIIGWTWGTYAKHNEAKRMTFF